MSSLLDCRIVFYSYCVGYLVGLLAGAWLVGWLGGVLLGLLVKWMVGKGLLLWLAVRSVCFIVVA